MRLIDDGCTGRSLGDQFLAGSGEVHHYNCLCATRWVKVVAESLSGLLSSDVSSRRLMMPGLVTSPTSPGCGMHTKLTRGRNL